MDNYFKECPAKMSDGRFLTDYRTATRREEQNKYVNGITRDDDFRLFQQLNANKIMEMTQDFNRQMNTCRPNSCIHNYPTRMFPGWFRQEIEKYNSQAKGAVYPCEKLENYNINNTQNVWSKRTNQQLPCERLPKMN